MKKKKKSRGDHGETSRPQPVNPPNRLATLADMWPKELSRTGEPGARNAPTIKKAHPKEPPIQAAQPQQKIVRQDPKAAPVKSVTQTKPAVVAGRGTTQQRPSQQTGTQFGGARQVPQSQVPNARRQRYAAIISNKLKQRFPRPIRINLGIDLGTSFTKVVWRSEGTSRPVCFGGRRKELNDYLVPTVVAFDGASMVGGVDALALRKSKSEHRVSNFKMCLACVKGEDRGCSLVTCTLCQWGHVTSCAALAGREVDVIAAFFLAKVISKARQLVTKSIIDGGVTDPKIEWSANLAVPEKFMNQSTVLDGFNRVLKTAWLMADVFDELPVADGLDDILDCYACAEELATAQPLDCFSYPEVGAQIACVTLPRTARDGLYAFVDVGAGTVDASVFRLHTPVNDEPRLYTYAADVAKAGAAHIETVAGRNLALEVVGWFKEIKEGDTRADLTSSSAEEILQPFLESAVSEVSSSAETELRKVLGVAYRKELGTDRWRELQLVIGGGGAKIQQYRDAARRVFKGFGLAPNLQEQDLPVPEDFELGGVRPSDFHRFAVAYGLSHRIIDLHQVALPDEVKPLQRISTKAKHNPDDK